MHEGELVQERYALEARVGRGGMAEVWRAHDQRLNRVVAIKFLAPGFADNPEFLARLFNEARSIAAISHPHVTSVLDYGTTEAGPFLVMEYVAGGSLETTGEPMGPARAVEIMRQVAEGAGAAHDRGIIHRDIKPGNVLLSEDGSVKLADFGIASSEVGTNLTATGAAIGSPHYISPEQAMGEPVTPRADVYSMGVCLYQLLTGTLPFVGDNPTAIAISHVEQSAEPPSSLVPELDPRLDALVMRCLEKRPEARFADGKELAAALAGEEIPAFAAASESQDETSTAAFAAVVAGTDPERRSPLSWNLKKLGVALIALLAIIAIGIHLNAQPSIAEAKRATSRHRQPSPKASASRTPGNGTSAAGPGSTVPVSPSPSPSPSAKKHSHGKKRESSTSSHPKEPKAKPTQSPAPITTPTTTTTTTTTVPTPTPTASPVTTAAAAPVPSPNGS